MMNASSSTALTLGRQAARRFASRRLGRQFAPRNPTVARGKSTDAATTTTTTTNKAAEPEFIKQMRYQNTSEFMKATWLSDPSTYPIFVVLGGALLVCGGRCIHGFANDDVKVTPTRRHNVLNLTQVAND